jgi:multimeric flavodoxin WrbA
MIDALLDGLRSGGSDITRLDLVERDIRQCRGCHRCWAVTPGTCVQDDDMRGVIGAMRGADFFIFGSPVYFSNVSGTLKTFFDRLTAAGGDPHTKPAQGEEPAGAAAVPEAAAARETPPPPPRYVMMANCGFPDPRQFDVVSLWIHRVAAMSGAELAGEFYLTGGKAVSAPGPGQTPLRARYLDTLRACGACYAAHGKLNADLAARTAMAAKMLAGPKFSD